VNQWTNPAGNRIERFEVELNVIRIVTSETVAHGTWDSIARSVTSHELGHVAGLADNPPGVTANNSIMNYARNRPTITFPRSFDVENVNMIH